MTLAEQVYYAIPNEIDLLKQTINRNQENILSPFDNVVIQRKQLSQIFDFDYQIECYVPPAKRQYGHLNLTLLWSKEFVGCTDAKIARKTHILYVQNLDIGTNKVDELINALQPELKTWMQFNNGKVIEIYKLTGVVELSKSYQRILKQTLSNPCKYFKCLCFKQNVFEDN